MLLDNLLLVAAPVSELGAATSVDTGTDNAATALIAAVDSSVSSCFFFMDWIPPAGHFFARGQRGETSSALLMLCIEGALSFHCRQAHRASCERTALAL